MRWIIVAALLATTAVGAAAAQERQAVTVDGLARPYLLHRPAGREARGRPVVLVLHEADSEAGETLRRHGWDRLADAEGIVVVGLEAAPARRDAPAQWPRNPRLWRNGSGAAPPDVDDVAYVRAVLDDLPARLGAAPSHVFAAGFGAGGSMAQRLAVELSDHVTGVASVAGHVFVSGAIGRARPVYLLFGTRDPLAPIAGGPTVAPWDSDGRRPPIRATVEAWHAALACPPGPAAAASGGGIRRLLWAPCRDGAELMSVEVDGLGHQWPGAAPGRLPERIAGPPNLALDATADIWQFFARRL